MPYRPDPAGWSRCARASRSSTWWARSAVVPVSAAGRLEPLCAIYHRCCLPVLEAALAQGRLKMRAALENLHVLPRPIPAGEWFINTNTPQEWQKHISTFGKGSRAGTPGGRAGLV